MTHVLSIAYTEQRRGRKPHTGVCGFLYAVWAGSGKAAMLDLSKPQHSETPVYPYMTIGFPPTGGILLTIIYSAVEKRDLLIPQENAVAMCMGFLQKQVPKKPALKQVKNG